MSKGNGWLKTAKQGEQVNGLLDKGCSVEGKIVFDGTVQINGEFTGEIQSEGTLVIGQDARVSGSIRVDTLVCYGSIDGKVEAKSRIEIRVPSVVTADITTKGLMIEEGALFQGNCSMHAVVKSGRTEVSEGEGVRHILGKTNGVATEITPASVQ